jgi:amino acid transporter
MESSVKKVNLPKMILFTVCGVVVLDTFVTPATMGVSSITLWILTALVFFIPYGLVTAELGAAYPDDGGIFNWVQRAFGNFHGTLIAWYYWVNVAFWMPAVFIAFSYWFSISFIPSMGLVSSAILAIIACWVIVYIGIRGVDLSVKVTNIAAIAKVAVLFVFGVLGVVYFVQNGSANSFALSNFKIDFNFNTISFSSAIVYNLLGFELISSIASTIENPAKNIPKMTILAGLLVSVLYIIGTFGVLVAIPASSIDPLDGFVLALRELTSVCGNASGFVYTIIVIIALFTLISNMISWSLGGVEVLNAAPFTKKTKILGHVNKKYNTPDYSYILMGVIGTLLIVLNFSLSGNANDAFWTILSFSFLIFFLPYIWMFPAAIKLALTDKETKRPYTVPGGVKGTVILSIIGFIIIFLGACLLFVQEGGFDPIYHGTLIIGTIITTLFGVHFYRVSER